jgi:predicted ribosomally synthesized peptide with nif11-like leader
MSIERVREFMKSAEHDQSLQKVLQSIPKGGGQWTVTEVVKVAAKAGFQFTAQDYEDAVNQVLSEKHAAGALNDAELALISGGLMCVSSDGSWCTCCPNPKPKPGTSHPIAGGGTLQSF